MMSFPAETVRPLGLHNAHKNLSMSARITLVGHPTYVEGLYFAVELFYPTRDLLARRVDPAISTT